MIEFVSVPVESRNLSLFVRERDDGEQERKKWNSTRNGKWGDYIKRDRSDLGRWISFYNLLVRTR